MESPRTLSPRCQKTSATRAIAAVEPVCLNASVADLPSDTGLCFCCSRQLSRWHSARVSPKPPWCRSLVKALTTAIVPPPGHIEPWGLGHEHEHVFAMRLCIFCCSRQVPRWHSKRLSSTPSWRRSLWRFVLTRLGDMREGSTGCATLTNAFVPPPGHMEPGGGGST